MFLKSNMGTVVPPKQLWFDEDIDENQEHAFYNLFMAAITSEQWSEFINNYPGRIETMLKIIVSMPTVRIDIFNYILQHLDVVSNSILDHVNYLDPQVYYLVKKLVSKGARPIGATALYQVIGALNDQNEDDICDICEFYLHLGADPNVIVNNNVALTMTSNVEIMSLCLLYNSDPNIKLLDSHGSEMSILEWAIEHSSITLASLLLVFGAQPLNNFWFDRLPSSQKLNNFRALNLRFLNNDCVFNDNTILENNNFNSIILNSCAPTESIINIINGNHLCVKLPPFINPMNTLSHKVNSTLILNDSIFEITPNFYIVPSPGIQMIGDVSYYTIGKSFVALYLGEMRAEKYNIDQYLPVHALFKNHGNLFPEIKKYIYELLIEKNALMYNFLPNLENINKMAAKLKSTITPQHVQFFKDHAQNNFFTASPIEYMDRIGYKKLVLADWYYNNNLGFSYLQNLMPLLDQFIAGQVNASVESLTALVKPVIDRPIKNASTTPVTANNIIQNYIHGLHESMETIPIPKVYKYLQIFNNKDIKKELWTQFFTINKHFLHLNAPEKSKLVLSFINKDRANNQYIFEALQLAAENTR